MKYFAILVSMWMSLSACAESPLFNHTNAGDGSGIETQGQETFKDKYSFKVTWLKGPQLRKESQAIVSFYDLKTGVEVVFPGEVTMELWMPDMGHGSAETTVEKIVDKDGVERVLVKNIQFLMGGVWQLKWQFTEDGETSEAIQEVVL